MTTSDSQSIAQIANRALEDQAFAERILSGEENYPTVREAMLKDLAESHGQSDVQGFQDWLQTQSPHQVLSQYIQNGQKPGGQNLANLGNFMASW